MFDLMLRCFGLRKKGDIESPYETYVKIFTMTMRITGLWKSGDNRKLNLFITVPYIVIALTGILAMFASIYETRSDFVLTVETLLYQILLIHSFNAYVYLILRKDNILEMIGAVENRFHKFEKRALPNETGIKKSSEIDSIRLTKFCVVVICSVHVTHTIASKFYLPQSTSKNLFFSIVLPYKLHQHYYIAFFLELAIYIFEGIVNLSSITINVGFMNLLCNEFDIFGVALREMYDTKNEYHSNGQDVSRFTKLDVRGIVDHHNLLIRLAYNVQSVLSFIVMDMFVTCEFMLCLCSFQIYQIYSTTTLASLMKNICMLSALIVHEFVYFFYGQRLVTKTSNLHQSVYFCKWYNESKPFKSSLSIVQCRTSKPFVVMAGKIVPVTLTSFIKCLQAAFSYFNLLRALSHV